MSKSGKKKNFTESEMEVLLSEMEAFKNVLFGRGGFCFGRSGQSPRTICERVHRPRGEEKKKKGSKKKKMFNLISAREYNACN